MSHDTYTTPNIYLVTSYVAQMALEPVAFTLTKLTASSFPVAILSGLSWANLANMAIKGKKGKKRICSECRKSVCKCEKSECQVAEPVREIPVEAAEPPNPEDWEAHSACEKVKDPEPIPEAVSEAVEPAAAEDWEIPCPACEEVKDPEPIPEDAGEAVEPAVAKESDNANMPTAGGLVICEYVQPKSRFVT